MGLSAERPNRRAGFTLLEVMITAVIIGILATIALPMFIVYQLRSKSAEVKSNLAAIQMAEQAYFAEFGAYVSASAEPAALPGAGAAVFDTIGSDFAQIGFAPEGSVYFSYGVSASADEAGYTADAGADIDANGIVQFWGYARPDGAGALTPGQVGCDVTALVPLTVGPCNPAAGRSIF
jgi:prepilin-type N-terminal cleavage/methylation domain-containing protein